MANEYGASINRPIFVTGNARQGTTFQQWFLSSHPSIHIFGQELIEWSNVARFLLQLLEAGRLATNLNRLEEYAAYEVEHWAGSSEERTIKLFAELIWKYLSGLGPNEARWGLKTPWQSSSPSSAALLEKLFPECRWVVCVRHPFRSFESQRSTFDLLADARDWMRSWVESVNFAQSQANAVVVQIDALADLGFAERKAVLDHVLEFVGERPCSETDAWVQRWPSVHRMARRPVQPVRLSNQAEEQLLSDTSGLREAMGAMGYLD